jgi:hypothetical protein
MDDRGHPLPVAIEEVLFGRAGLRPDLHIIEPVLPEPAEQCPFVPFTAALSVIHWARVCGRSVLCPGLPAGDSTTSIWFFVRVPVLSVQIVVAEPMVSQAIRRRTRQFARVIFCMASESERATLIGRPSGTAATTITTASMK